MKDSEKLLQRGGIGEAFVEINNGHISKKKERLKTKQKPHEASDSYTGSKEYSILLHKLAAIRNS